MGCGTVAFQPTVAYVKLEALFRSRSLCNWALGNQDKEQLKIIDRELDEMNLVLETETGELLNVVGFSVLDYRHEFPEEGLHLEFLGMHHEQFERLFPGQYAKYRCEDV
jgi:hypothetical protein